MEPLILLWYAIVCGALAVFAPHLRRNSSRAAFGILTGVVAAAAAPTAVTALRGVISGFGG